MKKLTFLLLSLFSVVSFAGNYADKGTEGTPQNNKESEAYFYIDLGTAGYYFDQPSTTLPLSTGFGDPVSGTPFSATAGDNYDSDKWLFSPSIALGYQFLTDNVALQNIFGQQNAIELRASYFHGTGTQNENYDQQPYYIHDWPITGGNSDLGTASYLMTDNSIKFDNTYTNVGLYYTGNKVINNSLLNSPYVGIDISYLKQDSNYSYTQYFPDASNKDQPIYDFPLDGIGSEDLSSYYMGLALGDKATWLFAKNYGVYGKLGTGLYWMHTKLSASQTPVTNQPEILNQALLATYSVETTDDQATFKVEAEVGLNYYFRNNQDPMSARLTLLAGLDYWNDVAYADNPTAEGQAVTIAYDHALNPYAGLQLHIPL